MNGNVVRASLVTAPTEEPVSLDEAKAHCRINTTSEDDLILALIIAARTQVEAKTERALVTQVWDFKLDDVWDYVFDVPKPPLQTISFVKYVDYSNVVQTLSSSLYQFSAPSGPHAERGRLMPVLGAFWPIARPDTFDAYTIRAVCGYGLATAVPQPLKNAILFLVAEMYDRRSESYTEHIKSQNFLASDALCAPFVCPRW
jgi:uncharacterized phiE125 gp8 family phage protein